MMVRFANEEDMEQLMSIRLECLRAVNGLDEDYAFSPALLQSSRDFFRAPDQLTVLAMDGDKAVACATLCFLHLMPTFSHPTGHRGHLMNVYTRPDWRRQGIARRMIDMLLRRAREEGKIGRAHV